MTNPIESIINTVTGFKGFLLPTSTPQVVAQSHGLGISTQMFMSLTLPSDVSAAQSQVDKLSKEIQGLANDVAMKQTQWQGYYQDDLNKIAQYIAGDYRGKKWNTFNPKTDLANIHTQAAVTNPQSPADLKKVNSEEPPSELDYAQIQADLDVMKTIQSRFTARCTSAVNGTGGSGGIPPCDQDAVATLTASVDQASAILSILQDNFKVLQTAQATVTASIAALDKIYSDFLYRKDTLRTIEIDNDTNTIVQFIRLPSDYAATDTGTVSCSTDTTPAVATTDTMNYTILFQNVPLLTASAGLLTTLLQENVYGVTQLNTSTATTSSVTNALAITNSAPASVFPMAFVNVRTGGPALKTWWGEPHNELVIANSLSAGIGVNPNTGTNQVEFFTGDAVSFNRIFVHFGAHFGRTQTLDNGFSLGPVPTGFSGTTAPVSWSYHPAFSIGLSVRVAPF